MAKVKVAVYGSPLKTVFIDTSIGAQIQALERQVAALQSAGAAARHSQLQGLQVGDDHPQYTMWQAAEVVKAPWRFEPPVTFGPDGELSIGNDGSTSDIVTTDGPLNLTSAGVINLNPASNVLIPHDSRELRIGAGVDLRFYHDGTNSLIDNDTGQLVYTSVNGHGFGGALTTAITTVVGAVEGVLMLRSAAQPNFFMVEDDGPVNEKTWRIVTSSGDLFINGVSDDGNTDTNFLRLVRVGTTLANLTLPIDSEELQLGAGSDLRLFHNGTNSFIRNDTGELHLAAGATSALVIDASANLSSTRLATWTNAHQWGSSSTRNTIIHGDSNGEVRLRFDDNGFGIARLRNCGITGAGQGFSLISQFGTDGTNFFDGGRLQFVTDGDYSSAANRDSYINLMVAINGADDTVVQIKQAAMLLVKDNYELQLGAGQDFRFYHDGTHSFIRANSGDLLFSMGGTTRFGITDDGRIYGSALHNNASSVGGASNQFIASGTYTPTLTNTTNVSGSTAYVCQWLRVGNVVTVSGRVDIQPTSANVNTSLGVTLPLASNLSAAGSNDLAGVASASNQSVVYAIFADATNDRATFGGSPASASSTAVLFTFTYLIA